MSARVFNVCHNSAFSDIQALDLHERDVSQPLPTNLEDYLEEVLRGNRLFETVTMLSLSTMDDTHNKITIDTGSVRIGEDLDEIQLNNQETILQDIEDMGCPKYLQSEVVVESRLSPGSFIVQVGSQLCVERKLPFVGAQLLGENSIDQFFKDLRVLWFLRGC